jgi:tetratricopeptide (TPR) repeat protein
MDTDRAAHRFVRGGLRRDRAVAVDALGLPPQIVPTVDAHQRLRGPYTAAGAIVRALAPDLVQRDPALVTRYDIELLSAAPDLSTIVPNSRETLTSMALPAERTRYYAQLRSSRIANGLVEFIRDGQPDGRVGTLVVENVEHAEKTDLEFLAAALRRLDPAQLTVVVCTGPAGTDDDVLLAALEAYAEPVPVGETDPAGAPEADAEAYVWTDCTSDEPALIEAYAALPDDVRRALHDRRVAELAAIDDVTLGYGAIPFHLEQGTDCAAAAADALFAAEDHALVNGYYPAVVEYARRGLALVDVKSNEDLWWRFTVQVGLALSVLARTHEAMDVYNDARFMSMNPSVHMHSAYSTAMLYTRHNVPEERDEKLAKSWLNSAIATAALIPDPSERAFQSAFFRNGLALVEVNLGAPSEALRLVDWCIDHLDRLLQPHEHRLHRSVLKNNRARVYLSLGRLDDALADYAIVIRDDPNHAEHYLERGNILRRLGRTEEAFADYDNALRLSPPFPEIYYNRGDLRMTVGDVDGAMEDFSYVIELNPEFVDAYVNRAGAYLDQGDIDAAYADAIAGLALDPDNAYLLVALGQVHAERGDHEAAKAAYDHALDVAPELLTALSGRATLAYQMGELDAAMDDLVRAVDLDPEDALLRYNRAFVYQGSGRWDEALADLDVAVGLAPDDPEIIAARESCRLQLAAG